MMYAKVVLIPLFAMALQPSFWDRSDEAAACGEIEVFSIGAMLLGCQLEVW